MRKLASLLAVALIVLMASCGGKNKYVVTGAVQNSYDGDKVYLVERTGEGTMLVDSAIIANGVFKMEGIQETPVVRYLGWSDGENEPIFVDFFLENGNIEIYLADYDPASTVKGTPTNEAYQVYKNEINDIDMKLSDIFQVLYNPAVSEEEKEGKKAEREAIEKEKIAIVKRNIVKNAQSPLGRMLIVEHRNSLDYAELDELLKLMPVDEQESPTIQKLRERVENYNKTAVGMKFTDLEMLTPEGNAIKLSDYAGKGKIVLIDFWASWCPPCRREMPRLVEAYAKYKDKGFEIVGVSFDRDGEAWKKGIEQLDITWPQMSDLKYWDSEGSKVYAVRSIPHVILIDGEGTIVSRGLHGDELQAKIAELMGE